MNATHKPEAPDDLDRMFSDFFKAQLKQPWPNAPLPPAAKPEPHRSAFAEVLGFLTKNRPQLTLAASVALALGAGLLLSNQFQPGDRPGRGPAPSGPSLFDGSDADGNKGVLPQIDKNKALDNGAKMDLGKIE